MTIKGQHKKNSKKQHKKAYTGWPKVRQFEFQ